MVSRRRCEMRPCLALSSSLEAAPRRAIFRRVGEQQRVHAAISGISSLCPCGAIPCTRWPALLCDTPPSERKRDGVAYAVIGLRKLGDQF
jgi:hypothetical protein